MYGCVVPYAFVVSSMELSFTRDNPSLGPYRGKIFNEKMSINDRNPANAIRKNVFIEFVIVLLGCVLGSWGSCVLCIDSREGYDI